MADSIGNIDSSRLKDSSHKQDHKKRHHKKYKETKERRHEYDADVYERYSKKSIPECIQITRDIERRKDMQKAKQKQQRRREKRKNGRDPRGYGGRGRYDYDSSSDDEDFKGFGGFGGSYSKDPFGRSNRAMMVRRQAANMGARPARPKPRPRG